MNSFTNCTCGFNSGIRGFAHRLHKLVVFGIEGVREGAIYDPAVDVGAEIDLYDIIVFENSLVSGVGSVVGGAVVPGTTGGKGEASL